MFGWRVSYRDGRWDRPGQSPDRSTRCSSPPLGLTDLERASPQAVQTLITYTWSSCEAPRNVHSWSIGLLTPWGKLLTDRGTACSAGSVTPTPGGTVGCCRATTRRRRRLRRPLRGPLPAARSPSCIPSLRSHPGRIDVRGRPRGARGAAAGDRASLALDDRGPGVVSGPGPHSRGRDVDATPGLQGQTVPEAPAGRRPGPSLGRRVSGLEAHIADELDARGRVARQVDAVDLFHLRPE